MTQLDLDFGEFRLLDARDASLIRSFPTVGDAINYATLNRVGAPLLVLDQRRYTCVAYAHAVVNWAARLPRVWELHPDGLSDHREENRELVLTDPGVDDLLADSALTAPSRYVC